MITTFPTYFVSHGGGPWPYMKDQFGQMFAQLKTSLQDMPRQLGVTPKAVLVISGHWEEKDFTVSASPNPPMIYDYSGFPAHTYQVKYSAPGSPELALRVQSLIQGAGHSVRLDCDRGFDHGTFTVMYPMYPEAQIPVVQLSLKQGYDPKLHLQVGQALAPLRKEGVLIIGSGLSYHNLRNFGQNGAEASKHFDDWLQKTLVQSEPRQRVDKLIHWAKAPAARLAHPQEDHLLPLMVAVGAAQYDAGVCVYHQEDIFGGIVASSFCFGKAAA
ncbi:class III extradiol ring-cleavage dioxygenase [Nostoc sp. NMS4]|uniref:DODA-type extradiol aromatic ring-opening family dioxygenase n=1 Tax=Nostoc sp. NMS4 TaxID=2815390 RepID=UPI0025DF8E4F|nr:class III extradiol ring-cleavage dioxygenase [Nostoc sp. NMS4]MBN3925987.1 dioxygenase [Nostoc sp. NMS4]